MRKKSWWRLLSPGLAIVPLLLVGCGGTDAVTTETVKEIDRPGIGPVGKRDALFTEALANLRFEDGRLRRQAAEGVLDSMVDRLQETEVALREGRKDVALKAAARAVVAAPRNPRALERLGHVLWLLGRRDQAEAAFATALDHDPDDAPALVGMAWIRGSQQRWEEAAGLWQRVLALDPQHPRAAGRLAVSLYMQGDLEAARLAVEEARLRDQVVPTALAGLLDGKPARASLLPPSGSLQVSAPRRVDNGGSANAVETSLAIAPGGNQIVAAWNDAREPGSGGFWSLGVGVSDDGGVTWSDSLIRRPGVSVDNHEGDPMTLYEPRSGYFFVGGVQFTTTPALFVARKAPGASSFETPVTTHDGGFVDRGWLASGPIPGNLAATRIYAAFSLGVQSSDDLGSTWTPVTSLEIGISQHPEVDSQGRLYVLDWNFDAAVRLQRSFDGGSTFLPPVTAATRLDVWDAPDGSRFPGQFRVAPLVYLAIDPTDDDLYALYFDTTAQVDGNADVDLYLARSSNQGATWSTPRIIPAQLPGDQFHPWLEIDALGRFHLLYFDGGSFDQDDDVENGRFHMHYGLSLDKGQSWETVQLTSQPIESTRSIWSPLGQFLGDFVQLGVDGDRVYALYPRTSTGNADIVLQTIDVSGAPLFADGFESGNTSAWSGTVP
ncbi:MAG: tetratricopeptide repeat protein [Acidobacteriota bacterium]